VWSYDFVMDRTADGRAFRMLTIVDEFTRECLAIDVARKLTSEDVLERLSDLFVRRGEDALHRAGIAMGERLRGELQWQTARRAAGPGSL
jgi:transposase InsO family protein